MAKNFDFCKHKTIIDSIRLYQQGKYDVLNAFLWGKRLKSNTYMSRSLQNINVLKEVAKDTINLSSIMQTAPCNVTLYRGDNDSHFAIESIKKGSTILLKGFTSTSESLNVAQSFATSDKKNTSGIIFEIRVPNGGKLLKLENAEFSFEQETLLPPAKYDVLDVYQMDDGKYCIIIEQKEILNISNLLDDGLTNISKQLPLLALHKKVQISHLKNSISRYMDNQSKNQSITVLQNVQASVVHKNNDSGLCQRNIVTNGQTMHLQNVKTVEDEREM